MYKLEITRASSKFLKKLPVKQFRQIVLAILDLSKDPRPNDVRQLKGYSGFYRKDIGEYRIIFRIDGDSLKIAIVGKRNDDDVYKRFKNLR